MINIIPINDIKEHIEDSTCQCYPEVEILENGEIMIIHNAYDMRDQKNETSTKAAIVGNTVLEAAIKSDWNLLEFFKQLRFDKNHHLGMGDIRLTIGMQEEICELVDRFYRCR